MRRNFPDPTDGSAGDPLYGQMITPRGPPALGVIGKGVVAPTGVVGLTAVATGADPDVPFSKSTFSAGVA
jgi:hypothetical protein